MTDHSTTVARKIDWTPQGAALTDLARVNHPTVSWWWGRRTVDGVGTIVCYICDSEICPWGGQQRTWDAAHERIRIHEKTHSDELRAETTVQGDT